MTRWLDDPFGYKAFGRTEQSVVAAWGRPAESIEAVTIVTLSKKGMYGSWNDTCYLLSLSPWEGSRGLVMCMMCSVLVYAFGMSCFCAFTRCFKAQVLSSHGSRTELLPKCRSFLCPRGGPSTKCTASAVLQDQVPSGPTLHTSFWEWRWAEPPNCPKFFWTHSYCPNRWV